MEEVLAIDFGTTNSVVYALINKKAEQLWNNQNSGEKLFPSFVEYTGKSVVVGSAARSNLGRQGRYVVTCVKRLIGKTYDEYLKLERKDIFGCEVVRGDDGMPYFVVSEDGKKKVSCIDVACELFKWLKANAEIICERKFTKAYVTRPANYLDNQVKAIREAARRAGLNIDKMFNEPTAAGLSWCVETPQKSKESNDTKSIQTPVKLKPDDKILVIDFGGGTLDFSVIRYEGNNSFHGEDNSGNPNLGGNDIDYTLVQLVLNRLKSEYEIDIEKMQYKKKVRILTALRDYCEKLKIVVNSNSKDDDNYEGFKEKNKGLIYEVSLPSNVLSGNVPEVFNFSFGEVTEAYMKCLEGAIKPLKLIIDKPGQTPKELSHVLLVGGSSQLMAFRQLLYRQGLERTQFAAIDPMTCVAKGAYELANIDYNPKCETKMTESIPISYGLKSGDNSVVILLRKGQKIPAASQGISFTNMSDEPARIEIVAYQCVDDEGKVEVSIEKCNLIKAWQFDNPVKYRQPKGEQLLELQFQLEFGGTLKVTCKDVARNKCLLTGDTRVTFSNQ